MGKIDAVMSPDKMIISVILKGFFVNEPPDQTRVITKITAPILYRDDKDLKRLWAWHSAVCDRNGVKPSANRREAIAQIRQSRGSGLLWGK